MEKDKKGELIVSDQGIYKKQIVENVIDRYPAVCDGIIINKELKSGTAYIPKWVKK